MTTLVPIDSYKALTDPLVLEQYKGSDKLRAVLDLFHRLLDPVETGFQELGVIYDLQTAVGAQLDLLGRVVNLPRAGLSDAEYRDALLTWLSAARSGTPEGILTFARDTTGDTSIVYIPEYPAGFWLYGPGIDTLTQAQLDRVSPAGVQGLIGCLLADALGEPITTADSDFILIATECFPVPTGSALTEAGDFILTEDGGEIALEVLI